MGLYLLCFEWCAFTLQFVSSASAAAWVNLDLVFLAGGPLFPNTLLLSRWATSFTALVGAGLGLVGGMLGFGFSTFFFGGGRCFG